MLFFEYTPYSDFLLLYLIWLFVCNGGFMTIF